MTKAKPGITHQRATARHFLLSRTDTGRLKKKPRVPGDDNKDILLPSAQRLGAKSFSAHVIHQLDAASQFGIMAMRLDDPLAASDDDANGSQFDWQSEITQLLDLWCRQVDGLWAPASDGIMGGFFPEKDASQCLEMARRFQKSFTEQLKLTVSIGIAAYPSVDYEKHQVLDNACKALDHAAFFGPNSSVIFDAVSLNISGDQRFDEGDISAAVEEFKQALILDPSNVNVHNSLGVCYGVSGGYQEALKEFKAAVELDPDEYMAVYNLGLIKLLSGQQNEALDFFLKANDLCENVFEVVFQTGNLYLQTRNFEKSVIFLEHACRLEPESATAHRYLGDAYAASNRPEAAMSAYKKAIKFNSNDADAMSALGCLFDAQNENPEIALMFCRESVALSPQNGLFRYRLGRLYLKQNRLEEAIKEFKKAELLGVDASDGLQQIKQRLASDAAEP